jgi:cysteinyl-tRNA synthetase
MLNLYNSLSRTKEIFKPIKPGKVGIYVCGITVYDYCHIGHARAMVCFDVIVRYLRTQFEVTYVRNITDIDDKIIQRAREQDISIKELTDYFIDAMHKNTEALGILAPDLEPRATGHIDSIIKLIEKLIAKKHAYVSDNGDVCFEVDSYKDYGKLSNKNLEDLISGARVEIVKEKKSPLDFVLWKKAKPGEPSWPSPWGEGRPGWHIECSAMAMEELGEQFDIHGGGLDLQFPHHENEIAQSESSTNKPFANYWLHVGLLQINNEKMSKSTNNFFTIDDVLKKHSAETIRYFLLSSHYRSPLNYSEENLHNAAKALTRLYQSLKSTPPNDTGEIDLQWTAQFEQAMDDDFNTPIALSILFQLSHELNKSLQPKLSNTLKKLGGILGILQDSPEIFLQSGLLDIDKETIERLIEERLEAKIQKNWKKADEIREELLAKGIELADSIGSTTWRKI